MIIAPLLDGNGRTAFFLGGQINCSTTIHSCSDVLRLLSAGEDSELVDEPSLNANPVTKSSGGLGALFKGLRSRNSERNGGTSDQPQREAGMEQHLIGKIERMNFREQMESFYTAYSKVSGCLGHFLVFVLLPSTDSCYFPVSRARLR